MQSERKRHPYLRISQRHPHSKRVLERLRYSVRPQRPQGGQRHVERGERLEDLDHGGAAGRWRGSPQHFVT